MASLKTTKKHHKHINNPFPSNPKTLPQIHGTLLHDPKSIPPIQIHNIGHDFHLQWTSNNGGSLSISRQSNPSKPLWSTIPGRAFVSAAVADTEIVESRGSFAISDANIRHVCNHQTVEEIRAVGESAVLIKGRIFGAKGRKRVLENLDLLEKSASFAKYWMVFDQRNGNEVGFRVRFGRPCSGRAGRKVGRLRRIRLGFSGCFSRRRVVVQFSPGEEEINVAMKKGICEDFNRIFITYSSEKSERFFGFGEQFSCMDLKGKRVPIFVQEQGIGRGDQPITFAANLVSYRAGGDESTTYAPSPFYITSKMRSLYLQGYDYSVFDLTQDDSVQIQVYGDMIEGRIMSGNSPAELIEHYTESIGRPQQLPEWILSGAVVGLQGGTDVVRHIWDQLKAMDTPVSET